jgi:excisionase family DNA binding protein
MPDGERTPPAGYLTVAQARARLGVSKMTMFRMMQRYNIPTYRDPRDGRVRLLKADDVDRLTQPVPEVKTRRAA